MNKISERAELINQAHSWINENIPAWKKKLAEFQGKAYLASGGKSVKFKPLADSLNFADKGIRAHLRTSYGDDLVAEIYVYKTFDGFTESYQEIVCTSIWKSR
jgi:hypothetical protein